MLRRLHIDNFKSLVNFDLELGRTHLLLGRNGSGKSAVFAALSRLKRFLHEEIDSRALFFRSDCTRWERRTLQTFELDVDCGAGGLHRYRLEIENAADVPVVVHESLTLGDRPIFRRDEDSVQMFLESGAPKPGELLVFETSSAFPHLTGRHDSPQLAAFRRWLGRARIVSINPPALKAGTAREQAVLDDNFGNFASWYRHLTQEDPAAIRALEEELKQVFGPEFQSLRVAKIDSERGARELRSEWRVDPARADTKFELGFDELSDGQRALICLYALLHAAGDEPALLCIDEPDNFVALNELQPWLSALSERAHLQTLLISHHPEIINFTADDGFYFYRRGQGPTRVKKFQELVHPDEPLTAAELVARGWIDADS